MGQNKIIRDIINAIEDDSVLEVAILGIKREYYDDHGNEDADNLIDAFEWDSTVEGYKFWSLVQSVVFE